MAESTDYYKVLVAGPTGTGKSTSTQNLDVLTTGYLNIENKPLPHSNKPKHYYVTTTTEKTFKGLEFLIKNTEVKVIVVDSFTRFLERLRLECESSFSGYDIWKAYNANLRKFLDLIQDAQKDIYLFTHTEELNGVQKSEVSGDFFKGKIEEEFSVIFYAEKEWTADGKAQYKFHLTKRGTEARCPSNLNPEDKMFIENDLAKFQKQIELTRIKK